MSGFKSTSYFVSLFRQHYNYTPRQYINKKL
ncbi:AraC family transcriptional regulator [Escherichia coli]|nr:AraC family transcriptional regulator [Escherichia coli]